MEKYIDYQPKTTTCSHQTSSVKTPVLLTGNRREVREEARERQSREEERWRERDAEALNTVRAGYVVLNEEKKLYRQLLLNMILSEDDGFLSTLNSTHSHAECHGFHTSIYSSTHLL